MIKEKNFEKFYERLQKEKDEIDKSWKAAKKEKRTRNIIIVIICTIICIIIDMKIVKSFMSQVTFSLFIIIWILICNAFIIIFATIIFGNGKKQREFYKIFKEKIIKKLMNNFYDGLEYFPEKQMPEKIYKEAKYSEYYNRYYSEDYLEASIDNKYIIDMAEVKTQEVEEKTDANGNKITREDTIFNGLFAKATIDKSINCELRINRNDCKLLNKNRLEMDSR